MSDDKWLDYPVDAESKSDPNLKEILQLLKETILPETEQPSSLTSVAYGSASDEENLFLKPELEEEEDALLDETWAQLRAEYNTNPAAFLAEAESEIEYLPEL